MALLGIYPAGTGVLTLEYMPEILVFVDTVTGNSATAAITSLSISNKGRQIATLSGPRIAGMARLSNFFNDPSQKIAEILRLGAGRASGSTTITFTHASANPIAVYGSSQDFSEMLANYIEGSINPNASQQFTDFNALILSAPATIDRVNLTFANRFNDDFTIQELRELLGAIQNTDTDGQLNGGIVIPNWAFGENPIVSAMVYLNGTGSCVFAIQRFVQS